MRETFATPGPVTLELRLPDGEIDVETGVGEETTVELTGLPEDELLDIAHIDMRERGGRYVVTAQVEDRQGWDRLFKRRNLRLEVRAPEGAEVRVRTGSADVRGRGRFEALGAETASGDVSFDHVSGDADVKTASGDVNLGEISGNAAVSTASGDIEIDAVRGAAQLRSASGDILVREAAADVTVQTASGDQQIDAVSAGQVLLQSASGDLTVGVRRGSRLAVDARSLSGDTSSEIDLDGDELGAEGDDGPLVELRATAMSGDIRVLRA